MNPTIFFSVCSLLYCSLLIINLFSKKEVKTAESKILKILVIINLFSLICEASGIFLGNNYQKFKLLNDVVLRSMLVLYIAWISFFIMYVLNVSKQEDVFHIKNYKLICGIMLVGIIGAIFLPIIYSINSEGVIIYSTGAAVQLVYYYAMAFEVASLFVMFHYAKKVKVANYASLFALVILSTLAAAIQSYYPSLLLCASTDTFVMYIAYFSMKKRNALNNTKKD